MTRNVGVFLVCGTLVLTGAPLWGQEKLQTINTGNFVTVPKETRHFALSKTETIVQVHGVGPFQVNPSEVESPDPPSGVTATLH